MRYPLKTAKSIFWALGELVNKNPNAHGGFTPVAVAPPNAIPLKQVIHYYRDKRRDGMGGMARFPPQSYRCFVFHILVKRILPSLFLYFISFQLMLNSF